LFLIVSLWETKEGASSMRSLAAHRKPWFPKGKQSRALPLHACCCFYVVKTKAQDQGLLKSSIRLLEQYAFKIFDFNKLGLLKSCKDFKSIGN